VGEFESARVRLAASVIALATLTVGLAVGPAVSAPTEWHHVPAGGEVVGKLDPAVSTPPRLSIEGAQFPPEGSTETDLRAVWGSVPPGCSLHPEWFSWFLPSPSSAEGTFATPGLADTAFVPASLLGGIAEAGLRSVAEVQCPAGNQTVSDLAFTNVTSNLPPSLTNLSVSPSASRAPDPVNLTGTATGGRPPYLFGVAWGDGSFTNLSLQGAGPFRVAHTFGPGTFWPHVALRDTERLDVRANLSVPVEVDNRTALTIVAARPLAEVGRSAEFEGVVERPETHLGIGMACAATVNLTIGSNVTNLSCTPVAPGTLDISLEVLGPYPQADVLVTREQPVAAPVSISLRALDPADDVGVPTFLEVTVAGGVPPFQISVGAGALALCNGSTVVSDGPSLVPWTPGTKGLTPLTAEVVDALGAPASAPPARVTVDPAPQLLVPSNATVLPSSTLVEVAPTVDGGSGPQFWWVTTSLSPVNESLPFGATTTGSFAWSGSYVVEGATAVTVNVVDGALDYLTRSVSIALPEAPTVGSVVLTPESEQGQSPLVVVNLSGGVPPFVVWLNASNRSLWNGTESGSGPFSIPLPPGMTGPVQWTVVVIDARGEPAAASLSTDVPSPRAAPSSGASESDPAPYVVGAVLAAVLAAFLLARVLRRTRSPDPPPPDPVEVLEGLIRPADGADRLTIEMLAEEEGVPLEMVRTTIDRLIREGRIRSESEPGGGEVLAWEAPSDP
jgi:hypothetical protein